MFGIVWLLVARITRYSSAAALCGMALTPVAAGLLDNPPANVVVLSLMAGLVVWRHRENIKRKLRLKNSAELSRAAVMWVLECFRAPQDVQSPRNQ